MSDPKSLILRVKREYFEAIASGFKTEEYRLTTPYWEARLIGRRAFAKRFDEGILITLGYPPWDDLSKILHRPWRGLTIKTIAHPHFGPDPVEVFAIKVNEELI